MSISTRAITGIATSEGDDHVPTGDATEFIPFIFSLKKKKKDNKMPILFSKWQIDEFLKQL